MANNEKQKSPLEVQLDGILEKRRGQSRLRILKASPPDSVDFSSNDFLSLSTNPDFRRDYVAALQHTTQLGSTGSRLLDGNSALAESLEKQIASFHKAPCGLLTNSGFDANVSLLACLPQPGDLIVYDELIHASVHDGMRQSRAVENIPFLHNSVSDLEEKLRLCQVRHPGKNIFVAVESVYSMEGDLAPLKEMVDLIHSLFPNKSAHLVVDEAHATGIYGAQGRGRVNELNLEDHVLVRLHTFGKALACNGAIILTTPTIRSYLINYARPLIYTTFLSHPNLVAIQTAYTYLTTPHLTLPLMQNLSHLITFLYRELQSLRSSAQPLLQVPEVCPRSPIFALLTPYPRQLASHCQTLGYVVRAVVPPTVPRGTERVRVCLHAGNTEREVREFVTCVGDWVEMMMMEEKNKKKKSQVTPTPRL